MADTKERERAIHQMGTKDIESQLAKLGIDVIDETHVRLPAGWSMCHILHRGTPTIILNEHEIEVARWDGGAYSSHGSKFFIVQENGEYSADDLQYMMTHIHCHAECHRIITKEWVAMLEKARKRRESVARSRAKRKAAMQDGKKETTDMETEATETTEFKVTRGRHAGVNTKFRKVQGTMTPVGQNFHFRIDDGDNLPFWMEFDIPQSQFTQK